MRPDFQMKDKNENIVYDSKDYVYRSEEKEPDKVTDEIAFEITTRKFKEMGFEGIISWVQDIARKDQKVFDQMITALKYEKKNAYENIQNADNDTIFDQVKRIIELDIWAEAIMVALRSANRDRLGDWWMFNNMDFYYQSKEDYFGPDGLDEMYIISQVQSWKEKAKDHANAVRKNWNSVMDRNLLIRYLEDPEYDPSVDEKLRMQTASFANSRNEWLTVALEKKNFFNSIKYYVVKSVLTEKLFAEEISLFYGKKIHPTLQVFLWTALEGEFDREDGMFYDIDALSRGKFILDKDEETGDLTMTIDYSRKF